METMTVPYRNFSKNRRKLLWVPYCLIMDHRVEAKKGERQQISLDATDPKKNLAKQIKQLGDKRELWMECLRCSLMINIKRKVTRIEQPRIKSTR